MAMYIKLEVGDRMIACYGVQRQEELTDEDKVYTYIVHQYEKTGPFGEWEIKPNTDATIYHKYSDGAEALAAKVLKLYV